MPRFNAAFLCAGRSLMRFTMRGLKTHICKYVLQSNAGEGVSVVRIVSGINGNALIVSILRTKS